MIKSKRKNIADELVASLDEAADILRDVRPAARMHRPPETIDVRAIRSKLALSQAAFAAKFGFSLASVREWEQGRRRPEQSARTLLLVIAHHPAAVSDALEQAAAEAVVAA